MRRFLTTSFILLALVNSAAGATPVAHAQFEQATVDSKVDIAAQANADVAATDAAEKKAAEKSTSDVKLTTDDAYNGVMQKILTLFAWLVGIAAITLDNAVYYTVVTMGDYVHNLSAIGVTWRILRDIGNIMLIFGFLAVGITTILNVDWYGSGKKMLPMMLVAAIFLNFSLFISEAVIDTGNLFATQFYTQINGGKPAGAKDFNITSIQSDGISNKIMGQLGFSTFYGNAITKPDLLKGNSPWILGFMGIILFIVTAFVLFSLAFVLITRFVVLIFLIILAPVGFAGLAIPQLRARANKWWDTLFEQTITAPVLLLMLYIALAVITDAKFLIGSRSDWTNIITDPTMSNITGFGSMLLSFLVAMGLLLAVVIQSKNLSAFGAAGASKLAGKLTFGATAFAGRTTAGWGANRAAKYLRSTAVGRVPLVGTGLVKGLEKVAGSNFDVRGTGVLKKFPGGGIDAGTAQKGGYKAELKARTESRTKYASELTGEKLTDIETAAIAVKENEIADLRKSQKGKKVTEVLQINQQIKAKEKEIEKLEERTDKGAKRKYASNLGLGYLGLDDKSTFNKYFNFAANTEAAKKIRDDAKKSKDDKELDTFRKALKKAGGEEEKEEKSETPKIEETKTKPSDE